MPVKFEWQFKYRDERFLNADAPRAPICMQKASIHAGFLGFCGFRFTLPVGDRVTIATTRAAVGRISRRRHPPFPSPHAIGQRMTLRSSGLRHSTIKMGKLIIAGDQPHRRTRRGRRQHVRIISRRHHARDGGPGIRSVEEGRSLHDQLLCRIVALKPKPFAITIQPFDLMSRRHPLSSIRASVLDEDGSNDVAGIAAGVVRKEEVTSSWRPSWRPSWSSWRSS